MVGAINVYIEGTTIATLEERAHEYEFTAHELARASNELDVLFEHERVEDFASYDFAMVEDAVALLDELASSGCRIRFVSVMYDTTNRASFEKMKYEFSALDKHDLIETIEYEGNW